MNFKSNKIYIENTFDALRRQSRATLENWNDPVQKRFYDVFINKLPEEVDLYLTELSKMDKLFEKAEEKISNLLK